MKFILFYHKDTSTLGENFQNSVDINWPSVEAESFQTINSMKERMKQHTDFFEDEVYIILVDSKSRLLELICFCHEMEDKILILILPDESEETMRLAMHLYPRFITRISDKYEELHLVLKQMADKEKLDGGRQTISFK